MNADAVCQSSRRLFYVSNKLSGQKFLVDTGAQLSIIPPRRCDKLCPSATVLIAANGSTIKTYGTRVLRLQLNTTIFPWEFIIADVNKPLLGADFLCEFGLMVDMRNKRLLSNTNLLSVPLTSTNTPHIEISNVNIQHDQRKHT